MEEQIKRDDKFFIKLGNGLVLFLKFIQSAGFTSGTRGWSLSTGGDVELNGSVTTSTNFTKVLSAKGLSFYISDGTTPNGNLSGNAGDVCFGADAGKAYKCTSTTTWVSFT